MAYLSDQLKRADSMDAFRHFAHLIQRLNPMETVLFKKGVHFVIIAKLGTTLCKIIYPVEACLLQLFRETSL
jgi:hypothetical protein